MNRKVQTAIYLTFAVLLVGIIVMANIMRLNSSVRSIKAVIEYDGRPMLVSTSTLEHQVMTQIPTLRSTPVKDVDKHHVAQVALKNPFIDSCSISINISGDVVIHAYQRIPVVRMFVGDNEFYIDRRGQYIPLSAEGSADIIVANGTFRQPLPKKLETISHQYLSKNHGRELNRVWSLASYLYRHPDDGILFDQIFLAENGDLYLVPKVGDHVVLIGDPTNLEEKLFNLMAFYKEGCKQVGWDTYSQISLKYKDQVICTERNSQ